MSVNNPPAELVLSRGRGVGGSAPLVALVDRELVAVLGAFAWSKGGRRGEAPRAVLHFSNCVKQLSLPRLVWFLTQGSVLPEDVSELIHALAVIPPLVQLDRNPLNCQRANLALRSHTSAFVERLGSSQSAPVELSGPVAPQPLAPHPTDASNILDALERKDREQ